MTEDNSGSDQGSSADKPVYVRQLEQRLAEKEKLLSEILGAHGQSIDEVEEAKTRIRRELTKDADRNRRQLIVEFLDIIDNLDRAIEAAELSKDIDTLVNGVGMVRDMFVAKLESLGVVRLDAIGHRFDPSIHEALTTVPVDDPARDGQVVGVMKEGYSIGEDVLRPASVAVGKKS